MIIIEPMKRLNHIFQKLNILIRKVLMYYFPGTATYWDLSTPCQINRGKTILGKYYLDFGAKYLYPGSITKIWNTQVYA